MPSVFISYAHKDGMEFTQRLSFALSMYMDMFWDRRLQAGDFPSQLYDEINQRDYFLLVMTPYSKVSEWCRAELLHAEKSNKKIALARVYDDADTATWDITNKYTYGDFTQDFDVGFRRITSMIIGEPKSSWEYLSQENYETLIDHLKCGYVPTIIVKEFAEWMIVEKTYPSLNMFFKNSPNINMLYVTPWNVRDVIQKCEWLKWYYSQMENNHTAIGAVIETQKIAERYIKELASLPDHEHKKAGEIAYSLHVLCKKYLSDQGMLSNDLNNASVVQNYFTYDVAEKLRSLITLYSRRSRYLY